MKVYIYTLSDPRCGTVKYVGQTNDPNRRKESHAKVSLKPLVRREHWVNQLISIGLAPVFTIIEETDENNWRQRERHWISNYRAISGDKLCNHTLGGEGTLGLKMRPESKALIGKQSRELKRYAAGQAALQEKMKTGWYPWRGKHLSEEHKAKIGAASRARKAFSRATEVATEMRRKGLLPSPLEIRKRRILRAELRLELL